MDLKNFNLQNYNSRLLDRTSDEDVNLLQGLCEQCNDFFQICNGKNASKDEGKEYLDFLPPNKGFNDKFEIGIFDSNRLVAFVAIVRNFNQNGKYALGILLLLPEYRGKGLGKEIVRNVENWVLSENGREIRVVVQGQNTKALKFWKKNGFEVYDEREAKDVIGGFEYLLIKRLCDENNNTNR